MMPNQGLVVRVTTCRRNRNAANACYSILILCVGWGTTALVVRANAADDGTAAQFNTATRHGSMPELIKPATASSGVAKSDSKSATKGKFNSGEWPFQPLAPPACLNCIS